MLQSIDLQLATAEHMENLLDALQLKARKDTDPIFRSNFDIRAWLKNGDRPSWVPQPRTRSGKVFIPNPDWVALQARIETVYDVEKEIFTRGMTTSKASLI